SPVADPSLIWIFSTRLADLNFDTSSPRRTLLAIFSIVQYPTWSSRAMSRRVTCDSTASMTRNGRTRAPGRYFRTRGNLLPSSRGEFPFPADHRKEQQCYPSSVKRDIHTSHDPFAQNH